MLDLNVICTSIKCGNIGLFGTLITDKRVEALVNRAVNRIMEKNKGYSRRELITAAQTIIWEEVSNNYLTAKDPTKGNHLAVRFLQTRIHPRLLNYIRDDKRLRYTDEGMIQIFNTVSIDSTNEDGEPYTQLESEGSLDFVDKLEEYDMTNRIKNIFYLLVKRKVVSVQDMYIFLLKYIKGMTNTKIIEVLKLNFDQEVSNSWLVKHLKGIKETVEKSLNLTKG